MGITSVTLTQFTWTPLNSTVVPMTQQTRKETIKQLSLRAPQSSGTVFSCHSLQRDQLHRPPLSSMSSHIFRGHLQQVNRINEGLLLVLSCNSHKHISPSTRFVVITPKPTRGGTRCTYKNDGTMQTRSIHVGIDPILLSLMATINTCLAAPSVTGKEHHTTEPITKHLFPWKEKQI